ncbi:E3 SUMO-protein ligase ZBED1-like [Rhipicephalus sanguineus]|uniref:E3 SUMO-protein ligase ZBED1-like n=1 Tax=Rhipicephalus sanguineus TaxID=34632 RepID=UPI001894083D|nr:E3 SUMO-protein ligase ZBED1-like [Rhipicephalus sanguineus]XP_037502734.1 E3 SUMO-protein ligase ZBED1-like [Rhipicephalus sanguineus]
MFNTCRTKKLKQLKLKLKLKEAICLELATSETTVANQAPQEWKAVAGLVKALEPIASATKDLSGHKYATLSSVVPLLYGTQMVLKDCIAADDDTSEFARNFLKSMRTRFPGQDEQKKYVLATACDPRFKNLFCTETFQETRLLELARTELQQLPPEEESSDCVEASTSTAHKERVSSIWNSIEKLAVSSERRHCTETANIKEFKRYLREPTCRRDQDPLAWWKETGKQHFPELCKMAMKDMGIPATSVPSEKLFSTAGNIVTARREKLTSDHVQQLLFLHENL